MPHFPIITGHRGAAGLAPENTLAGIKKAMELGVDRIEIDVHLTKDGVPVVIHDRSLKRTTNGRGFIKQKTLEELRQLSAGIKFNPTFKDEKIPTLAEVFELVNGKIAIQLEIKHSSAKYPGIESVIFGLMQQYNVTHWCFINSFDNKVLRKFKKLDPNFEQHKLLVLKFPILPAHIDKRLNLGNLKRYKSASEFGVYYKYVTPHLVKQIHLLHKKLNVWTPNDKETFKRLIALGVDGIITDRPDIAMDLKKEMGG